MKTLQIFFTANRKIIIILCVAFFFYGLVGIEQAHAGISDKVGDAVAEFILWISISLGGFVAAIGGVLLDASITHTVLKMGELLNPSSGLGGLGVGVQEIWKVLRDIINILFIFGLIYIGIRTILDSNDSDTRRTLGRLIIAALMINFSLYITQAIVDFTNVASLQIYKQIIGANAVYIGDSIVSKSISGAFVDIAGMTSFLGADPATNLKTWAQIFVYAIFMMFFLIVAGMVFAMGALLLIRRFISLTLYMILSPAMFIGFILPNFASKQKEWWDGFLKQAFFAPAFLFMLYLSLVVLQRMQSVLFAGKNPQYEDMMAGKDMDPGAITIVLFFCVAIGFLYASIKVGEMMGVAGASGSLKILDNMRNGAQGMLQRSAGGATFGLAGRAGRNIVGLGAHTLSEKDWLKDKASERSWGGTFARGVLKSSRVVGNASFDARQTGLISKDFGTGRKGGYKSVTEEIEKKEKGFAKSLDEVGDDDEKVKELTDIKIIQEKKLVQLKKDKLAIKPENVEDKQKNFEDIESTEKAIKQADEDIKREKNRRQIGSNADNQNLSNTTTQIKEIEGKIKEYNKSFIETQKDIAKALEAKDEEALAKAKNEAQSLVSQTLEENKKLKELRKKQKEQLGTLGYAGVLEKRDFLSSAIYARLWGQDRSAGEAIRKQYEKAVKKSKEEAANDGLKDAIKESAKKD